MLEISVKDTEYYDESTGSFEVVKGETLQLEHSLLSISKWESKWEKPFLSKKELTEEELYDYFRCMTIGKARNPLVYYSLTASQIESIMAYINKSMTATWFSDKKGGRGGKGQSVTSELIYYWMTMHSIPFETEKWHLNRLLTLIQVCNEENAPKKKMKRKDTMDYYKSLNAARLKKFGTKG